MGEDELIGVRFRTSHSMIPGDSESCITESGQYRFQSVRLMLGPRNVQWHVPGDNLSALAHGNSTARLTHWNHITLTKHHTLETCMRLTGVEITILEVEVAW